MADEAPGVLPHEKPLPPRVDLWTGAAFLALGLAILALAVQMPTFKEQKGEIYTAPGLVPGIVAGALLSFTLSLDEFVIAFFTNGPTTPTLPQVIYSNVRFGVKPDVNALATVLLVAVYRTPASLEAAWKYFILCGVGIAQALFGTILLYLAAERVLAVEGAGLLWTHLDAVKGSLEPTVIALAFVASFFPIGVSLLPRDHWLQWAGWLDIGLLVAAVLIGATRRSVQAPAKA